MKEFVFLYPIKPYIDFEFRGYPEFREGLIKHFNDVIDARYRKRGYGVNWVSFNKKFTQNEANTGILSPDINIDPVDKILYSGIQAEGFIGNRKASRPDPSIMLKQLPSGISELRVGGFHQWDCVDKLARVAYESGIPTLVDEDTTELYFMSFTRGLKIPLVRDKEYRIEDDFDEDTKQFFHLTRPNDPWFLPV